MTPSLGGTSVDEELDLTVTVPGNATSTSASAGTLTLQETNEVGDTSRTDVVGDEAFSIDLLDGGGTALTSNFTDDVTIEKQVTVAALDLLDIDTTDEVEDLSLSYYTKGIWIDESTTATYLDANGAVVTPTSTLSNVTSIEFTAAVDHFTVFAITQSADGIAPAVPTGVTATAASTSIAVSWTAVTTNADSTSISDLAGYEIYRDTTSVGDFTTQLNTSDITSTSYTDTTPAAGVMYFYKVTAADTGGLESSKSSSTSGLRTTASTG